jgi:hypothetical protein
VQRVDLLQDLLGLVEGLAAALGEISQTIPLVADSLAASVD